MQFPIGILIYWVHRFEENHAVISGMWYYKEIYVPSSIQEKKKSVLDLKEKRCTVITIHGTFDQITDILSQGDHFDGAETNEINQFTNLINEIKNSPKNKAYLFDDINNIQGTALMVDMIIEVIETMEQIQEHLRRGRVVDVNISENWSFKDDFIKALCDD